MKTSLYTRLLQVLMGILLLFLMAVMAVQAQDPDDQVATLVATTEPQLLQSLESPDGSLRAEVTIYPCTDIGGQQTSYERLDLVDNSTGETQVVAEQTINCEGLGAFGLWVRQWSQNSEYLYYTDAREGWPDGLAVAWVPPISRVRIADVQVEYLGQAAFSSNLEWIATWDAEEVRVISTETDETEAFERTPSELQIMDVIWLPGSSGLLYIQADAPIDPVSRSTVTHIDLTTQSQTVLLDIEN